MKLFALVFRPIPKVVEMNAADCQEAFLHASESFRNATGTDRQIIGVYVDDILDQYLALQ
jgi:hypothetical protein